jgi:tetratricopeptide (TPR) repeat protein
MSGATGNKNRALAEYRRVQGRLASMMNTDPTAAIVEARKLPADGKNWSLLRAAILCDAGVAAADFSAVEEASEVFARLVESRPGDGGLKYNLANALVSRAQLDQASGPDWFLKTAAIRRRARSLFGEAAKISGSSDPGLASQRLTNLGNSLDAAHRWVEAYECYQAALTVYPSNGVAAGCAARVLQRVAALGLLGHEAHLVDVALRLAHRAKENRDVVTKFAGPGAAEAFAALPSQPGELVTVRLPEGASEYDGFVAKHRLALSPVLEGLGHELCRWDDAHIATLSESIGNSATVPPLFAMFNVMKSDYLVARELLFQGLRAMAEHPRHDTGLYMDTLDYAVYGVAPSQLVLAQRAALDLLDRIAVALNEHLAVGLKAKDVNFLGFWREKPNDATWRPALAAVIQRGNPALIALSEIAADLTDGSQEGSVPGLLHPAKRARHAGTHRFVVLHDIGTGDSRPSTAVEHYKLDDFQETVLDTVRLARAALLHFLEVVAYSERVQRQDGALTGEMIVRPHHEIRGED